MFFLSEDFEVFYRKIRGKIKIATAGFLAQLHVFDWICKLFAPVPHDYNSKILNNWNSA